MTDPYWRGTPEQWYTYPFWAMAGLALLILVGFAYIIKGLWWICKIIKESV